MADTRLVVQIDGQDNLSGELKKIESGVIRFVGAISAAFTAVSAIGFPIIKSAEFQKELLNAAKTTDFTRDQLTDLAAGLRQLSTQVNVSAADLAKISTLGGQIGIGKIGGATELLEFTKTVATAVSALDLSAEQVVASFGKLVNIFNIPASEFRNALSALNEVSNVSNATAEQLFDVVRRIGNLGGSVKLPEAVALSATLIDLGLTAETAGTTITKIFADFKSSASDFARVVQNETIKTTDDWIRLVEKDGLQALTAYIDGLNRLSTADAAATKSRLTGEGRLFEAVTKLQEQRKREVAIQEEARAAAQEYETAATKSNLASTDPVVLKGLKDRAEALKQAATNANVLSRLTESARGAFAAGNSAEKEQQTILAGLSAQWRVFINNIEALATTAGDVFLPPLTAALKEASAALQNPVNADSLRRGAEDIVNAVRKIAEAISSLSRSISSISTGVDWGAILRIGALFAAFALFKGFIGVLKGFGASALLAIPGINRLGVALFGAVDAGNAASGSLNRAGQSAQRTGGLISAAVTGISTALNQLAVASQAQPRLAALAAATTQRLAQAQQTVNALFAQPRLSNYQTLAAIQQRITDQTTRLAAAQAAGQTARARGLQSDITYLTRQAALIGSAEAVAARYTAQLARITPVLNQVNAGLARINPAAQLGNLFSGLSAVTSRVAGQIATDFTRGAQIGFSGLASSASAAFSGLVASVARTAASVRAGFSASFGGARGAASSAVASIVAGFNSVRAAVGSATASVTAFGAAISTAGVAGTAAGGLSLLAGIFTRLVGALSSAAAAGGAAATGGIIAGLRSIAAAAGQAALSATGLSAAWTAATGRLVSGAVIAAAAVGLLAKGIGIVFRLALSAVNFTFLALLIPDLLKAIGLWDSFALAAQRGLKAVGVKETPAWLQTEEQARNTARAIAEINASFDDANKEAAKFTDNMQALILVASAVKNTQTITKALTFDPKEPLKAADNAKLYFDAIVTGYAKANSLAGQELALQIRISEEAQKLARIEQEARATAQKKVGSGASVETIRAETEAILAANEEYGKSVKIFEAFRDQLGTLRTEIDKFSGLGTALRNLAVDTFSAEEATKLFGVAAGGNLSIVQQYVQNLSALKTAQNDLAAADKKLQETRSTAKTSAEANLNNLTYTREAKAAKDRVEELTKANDKLKESIVGIASAGSRGEAFLRRLEQSLDPAAAKQVADALTAIQKSEANFVGSAIPKVGADDIVSAAVTAQVAQRLSNTYKQWADNVEAQAKRAKEYVAQALGEVEKQAKETAAFLEKFSANAARTSRRASNQLADRVDDAQSRQVLRNIQTRYDVERALLEQQFSVQQRVLAEQQAGGIRVFDQKVDAYAFEQQALFQLDEKYRRLKELEEDRLNIKKQRRVIEQELKDFDNLIKKVEYYKKVTEEANRVIADERAPVDKRLAAIVQRTNALDKLKALYSQIEGSAEKLSTTDPIGGELIISPAELERVRKSVEETSTTIGKVTLQNAGQIEGAYGAAAVQLKKVAQDFGNEATTAAARFAQLTDTPIKTAEQMSVLIGKTKEFSDFIDSIKTKTQEGLINPGTIDLSNVRQQAEELSRSLGAAVRSTLGDLKINQISIENKSALAEDVFLTFKEGIKRALGQAGADAQPVQAKVTGAFSPESLQGMVQQVQNNVKPTIQGKLDITDVSGAANLGIKVSKNARGGLIGDALRLGSGIASFASGGRVKGPGGGTDDRVLSLLSNGEYVMDALTTARFGPKFFASLQKAARGGVSTSMLRRFQMPQFAYGGPVGLEQLSAFSGIANNFNSSEGRATPQRETIDITIRSGSARSTVQAERAQAQALVGILRGFEKGL